MISNRSKLSLCQYLSLQNIDDLFILFEKHGIDISSEDSLAFQADKMGMLQTIINKTTSAQLLSLLGEIVRTREDLCFKVHRHRYDERWEDLVHCLLLDNYKIDGWTLISIEPSVVGVVPLEDDFTKELKKSGLAEASAILSKMDESANDFRKTPPDYNGCLTNARTALETLAKAIAENRNATYPGDFDVKKWGSVLSYLRISKLLTEEEEKGLAGVFGFVSPGAHRPVGFSEQEMARFGRNLVASMCYFLIKLHNQQ